MEMASAEFMITNDFGLHARSAAKIVQAAGEFQAEVYLSRDGARADGKSILDILTLACPKGSVIQVEAVGPDAAQAVETIGLLIRNGFGEGSPGER